MKHDNTFAQAGFSLVETVAALGILALAAIPLMQLTADATRNTAYLQNRVLARTVAENTLSRALAEVEALPVGISAGQESQMGQVYNWSLTVTGNELADLQTLEVTVQREGGIDQLARLVTLKALPVTLPDARPEDTPPTPEAQKS